MAPTTIKIHTRTLCWIVAGVVILVGMIYLISWITVMGGFADLEKRFLQKNILRSQEVIANRLTNLVVKLSDWAIWDDTYAFIEDKNKAYIKSNIVENALGTLQIDTMIFLNLRGELVYVLSEDSDQGIKFILPTGLKEWLTKENVLLAHADEKSFVTGVVMLPQGAMLVVSNPIVKSDGQGPIRGTMIFGVYLDQKELKRFSQIIRADMDVQRLDAVSLPSDFSVARVALLQGKKTFIKTLDAKIIAGYSILKDVSGKDVLILKVAMPREITRFGGRTLLYFIVALILVGLIFGSVVYVPLEREIAGRDRAEKRFIQIAEASEEFIWEVDKNGLFIFANPVVEKILGYKPQEIIGKKYFYDFYLPEEKERMKQSALEAMAKRQKFKEYVNVNMHCGGWRVILSTTGVPTYNASEEFVGYRGVDVDITQRKLAEEEIIKARRQAEKATQAKSEFLASMSHEIRTPMTAIIGFLDILEATPLNEQQKDYVKTISSSGSLLLDIINDILDLAKVESGELKFESIDFNLECLVEDVFKLIRVKLSGKPVEFFYNIGSGVSLGLEGDPARIRQILINILGNATKFTDTGSISLEVKLEESLDGGIRLIRFTVSDTGVGIPQNKINSVFDAFSQTDASTTRRYGGTGLGLSICRNYVDKMGGKIWVESEVGKGSRFIFTLRLKEKPLEEIGKGIYPVTMKGLKGKTILVIDDNDKVRQFVRFTCEEVGMTVREESQPEKVVECLLESAQKGDVPDIALIDIMMSVKDGFTLVREIRSNTLLNRIKLIAFSALAVKGFAAEAKEAGFDAYLPKPVLKGELISVLCTVLGDKRDGGQIVTKHIADELACKGFRVLVAEDNPVNQKLLELLLKSFGCTVQIVNNGQEALDELRRNTYDAVLMDTQMPVIDGFAATQVIRAEISRELPVLGLSAAVMKEDREKGFTAGMNDYLNKPINPQELKAGLLKWCGREKIGGER